MRLQQTLCQQQMLAPRTLSPLIRFAAAMLLLLFARLLVITIAKLLDPTWQLCLLSLPALILMPICNLFADSWPVESRCPDAQAVVAKKFITTRWQLLRRRGWDLPSFLLLHRHVLAIARQPQFPRCPFMDGCGGYMNSARACLSVMLTFVWQACVITHSHQCRHVLQLDAQCQEVVKRWSST